MTAEPVTGRKPVGKFKSWLLAQRASSRIALILKLSTMAASSVLSLVWGRVFVHLLGRDVYGLFISFQGVLRMATVGDFGITGALGIRTSQMLGKGESDRLVNFLASARTLYLLMAFSISLILVVLSPWLPAWLGFKEVAGAGQLTLLFAVGGALVLASFTDSYFQSLNSGCGSMMWPILPAFLVGQITLAGQWLLARHGLPLWALVGVNIVTMLAQAYCSWTLLRMSFPRLAGLLGLKCDFAQWRDLLHTSGLVTFAVLGGFIFTMTDRLLVNAGFGAGAVTPYYFNYKPVEMALSVVLAASYMVLSKLNIWVAAGSAESLARARAALERLNLFQVLAGTACALAYLALNNTFIALWVGPDFQQPIFLQWAFALTLVVTTAGDAGVQAAFVLGRPGLRRACFATALTGVLNFGLSFAAMRCGWLAGIAYATVIAQSALSLFLGYYICRQLQLSFARWFRRAWLWPVLAVSLLAALQYKVGSTDRTGILALLGTGILLMVWLAFAAGLTRELIREELKIVRGFLGRKKDSQISDKT
jgi:O-antigen/teichoic acid export membrane protein